MRVLHLTGSATSDFLAGLSRLYDEDCRETIADPRDEHVVAEVAPDGSWSFDGGDPLPIAAALQHLAALDVDLALPQMFCVPGMTHYRALLDVLGIPYLGNAPDVMALTADKAKAKAVVAAAGVRTPESQLVREGGDPGVELPVVVKPVDADNSHGVTLVRERSELAAAINAALEHSSAALVERYVELGREVRCGVIERGGELVCLPLEEYAVDSATKPVRDAQDKITGDDGLKLVAKDDDHAWILGLDDPVTPAVHDAARRAHRALGCRDYSLFDFRIDPEGTPWFLEAGLYCSFARQSVICTMARAAGMSARELFELVVDNRIGAPCP